MNIATRGLGGAYNGLITGGIGVWIVVTVDDQRHVVPIQLSLAPGQVTLISEQADLVAMSTNMSEKERKKLSIDGELILNAKATLIDNTRLRMPLDVTETLKAYLDDRTKLRLKIDKKL